MKNYSRFLLTVLAGFYAILGTGSLQAAEGAVDVKDFAPAVLSLDQAKELKNQFVFWLGKHYRCLYGGKCTRAEKKEVMAEWKRWGKVLGAGVVVALGAYFAPKGAKAVRSAINEEVGAVAARFEQGVDQAADKFEDRIDATLDVSLPKYLVDGVREQVSKDPLIADGDKQREINLRLAELLRERRFELRKQAIAGLTGAVTEGAVAGAIGQADADKARLAGLAEAAAGRAVAGAIGQAEIDQARLAAFSSAIVSAGVNAVLASIDKGALAKDDDDEDTVLTAAQRRERVQELTQQALRTILQIPAEQEIGEEGLAGAVVKQVLEQLATRKIRVPWMGDVELVPGSQSGSAEAAAAAAGAAPAQPGQPGYAGAGAPPSLQNPMFGMPPVMQGAAGFGAGRPGGQPSSVLGTFRGGAGFGGK